MSTSVDRAFSETLTMSLVRTIVKFILFFSAVIGAGIVFDRLLAPFFVQQFIDWCPWILLLILTGMGVAAALVSRRIVDESHFIALPVGVSILALAAGWFALERLEDIWPIHPIDQKRSFTILFTGVIPLFVAIVTHIICGVVNDIKKTKLLRK